VRGATGAFDREAQLFAARGYAVLEPNFRGSTGYGWKHLSAGFRQWGLAMQDDVTDGVLWAIEQGIADPKRVCIYGASYGGYAAMMGLAKTPELYRCGVNYVGVTDLPTMLTATWSDFAYSDYITYLSRDLVGDPERDRAALEAVSPARLAAKMRGAVLMAYGGADRRVPIVHGTLMKSALDAAGKKYEWLVMEGEGHGFRRPENQARFYEAVERFFAENLKD
jgi:dipeptidyl aminopeptidase/acylaminoacyl peptidase